MRLIDGDVSIDRIVQIRPTNPKQSDYSHGIDVGLAMAMVAIKEQPTIEPEIKPIEYQDCANAMLRMWIDNIVTDGEYSRIMDKLNAFWCKDGRR